MAARRPSSRNVVPTMPARLRELRDRAGYTLAQLAARIGSSASALVKIESGERSPSFELACRLADALGVKVDAFRHPPANPNP